MPAIVAKVSPVTRAGGRPPATPSPGSTLTTRGGPTMWRSVAALLERYPEVACAFSSVQRFGLDDQIVSGLVPSGEPCELLQSAFQSWLHTSLASIIRRSALEEVGGYDEARIGTDFDMWLRLAHHNLFVASPEVTANWRWHEGQHERRSSWPNSGRATVPTPLPEIPEGERRRRARRNTRAVDGSGMEGQRERRRGHGGSKEEASSRIPR